MNLSLTKWIILSLIAFGCSFTTIAQSKDSLFAIPSESKDSLWIASIKANLSFDFSVKQRDSLSFPLFKKIDSINSGVDFGTKHKRILDFRSGYVNYNFNYRSRIDTPYAEYDIVQHYIGFVGEFVLAEAIPLTVTYFERQSNSSFFRDFRDFRVDVNGPELRRLQREKIKKELLFKARGDIDPTIAESIDRNIKIYNRGRLNLQDPKLVQLLIESKDHLVWKDELDPKSKWKDSILYYSEKYTKGFERQESHLDSLKKAIDSVQAKYYFVMKKAQQFQKIIHGGFDAGSSLPEINKSLLKAGMQNSRSGEQVSFLNSLQHFSAGRVIPNGSQLTLRNINVRGVDAALGNGIWYAGITAGVVDFRLRDFVSKNQKSVPQSVYLATLGLGSKMGTHLFFTGYKGRKQIYSFKDPSIPVSGLSAELQYLFRHRHFFTAEIAHSSIPAQAPGTKSALFDLNDKSSSAYNVRLKSSFPRLKANAEGFYQRSGINYYAFNSYRTNAQTESWQLKYEQFLFGRQLRLSASARKNDFSNPLIEQRYSSNAVFKTLQATFKRRLWPTISIGFLPSSQYIVFDGQVYESHYQTFTTLVNHSYLLGTASASTNIFFSRFFNKTPDSSFSYYKAQQVSFSQNILFTRFTSLLTITYTKSQAFSMIVLQAGNALKIGTRGQIEGGVRINHVINAIHKLGLYGRGQLSIPFIGIVNMSYDDFYLPSTHQLLSRSQQFNIGLTRRIK